MEDGGRRWSGIAEHVAQGDTCGAARITPASEACEKNGASQAARRLAQYELHRQSLPVGGRPLSAICALVAACGQLVSAKIRRSDDSGMPAWRRSSSWNARRSNLAPRRDACSRRTFSISRWPTLYDSACPGQTM